MDLNINGKSAIVCASSKGLGKACALALAKEGVNVWISARHEDALNTAADEIAASTSAKVQTVVADVTSAEGRDALFAACPEPDIIINNAGGPPPGDFRDWGQQEWFDAINANMYSAIDMIRRSLDGMMERGLVPDDDPRKVRAMFLIYATHIDLPETKTLVLLS